MNSSYHERFPDASLWETAAVKPSGLTLLLSQVGAHVSARFAAAVGELDLTPPQVAVLRVVGQEPGLNQQAVAARLGVLPSKVVTLVDELEARRLVQRERSSTDRRQYALRLPPSAGQELSRLRDVVRRHDEEITAALNADERSQLLNLLQKIATAEGLSQEGHPGLTGPRTQVAQVFDGSADVP
jgi:DNA-binding MarR family transcriptional regulator